MLIRLQFPELLSAVFSIYPSTHTLHIIRKGNCIMKPKNIAAAFLAGCLSVSAGYSLFIRAEAYNGSGTDYFQYRQQGISQRRYCSAAHGQIIVWSSALFLRNGGQNSGKGSYAFRATDYVADSMYLGAKTIFYQVSTSGVRSWAFTLRQGGCPV